MWQIAAGILMFLNALLIASTCIIIYAIKVTVSMKMFGIKLLGKFNNYYLIDVWGIGDRKLWDK